MNAYQSDKRAFTQTVERARSEKESVMTRLEECLEDLSAKQVQIEEFEEERATLSSRLQSALREIDLTNANQNRLVNENRALNDDILRLKAVINALEEDVLSANE